MNVSYQKSHEESGLETFSVSGLWLTGCGECGTGPLTGTKAVFSHRVFPEGVQLANTQKKWPEGTPSSG